MNLTICPCAAVAWVALDGDPVMDVRNRVRVLLLGPDCGGKSTLARMLGEYYQIPVYGNRRIKDDLQALQSVLQFALEVMPFRPFVLDQWQYPVDIVYNKVLGNQSSPMERIADLMAAQFKKHKVLTLFVTASPETIAKRFEERGDELWNLEQILAIRKAYPQYLEQSGLFYEVIDTTDTTPEQTLFNALGIIETFYKGWCTCK